MPRVRLLALRPLNIRPLDIIVGIELFILTLVYSRTYTFFPALRSPLNWISFMIPLAFVIPALKMRAYAALITISIVVLLFSYQLWFVALWHTPFTGTALGSYQSLILAAMFAVHARNSSPSRALAILFIVTILYLFIYIYLNFTIDANSIIQYQMQGIDDFAQSIRRTHDSRGKGNYYSEYKIGTSGAIMSYMVIYALSAFVSWRNGILRIYAGVLLLLAVYGLWISDARSNTASVAVACLIMLIPMPSRWRANLGFALAGLGIVTYVFCAFGSANVFSLLAWDYSGAARARQFDVANPVYLETPWLGIGLKNAGDDFAAVFADPVYTADLGWYGDLIQFGILGAVLLFVSFSLVARFVARLTREGENPFITRMLSTYLVYLACVQFITPTAFSGSGAIVLSLAFAYLSLPRPRLGAPDTEKLGSEDRL